MANEARQTLDELAEVIGQANVARLCEALGGTRIYVPRRIGDHHPVAATIGPAAAAAMAERFAGEMIDLPKAHVRRQRVIELARSGRMSVAEAARACDYTERWVYKLLADQRADDDNQGDLFAPLN